MERIFEENGLKGVEWNGKKMFPPMFEDVEDVNEYSFLGVFVSGTMGGKKGVMAYDYMSEDMGISRIAQVVPFEYDDVFVVQEFSNFIVVTKNGKRGLYNIGGKKLLECEYDNIIPNIIPGEYLEELLGEYYSHSFALTEKDGKHGLVFWSYYNKDDNKVPDYFVVEPQFDNISQIWHNHDESDQHFRFQADLGDDHYHINDKAKVTLKGKKQSCSFIKGCFLEQTPPPTYMLL